LKSIAFVDWLALGIGGVGLLAIALDATSSILDTWTPNIATSAIVLALTIMVVDRIVRRQRVEEERDRVEQALRAVSGRLHSLADFILYDYANLHAASFERPPQDLRGLLAHWKAGLQTRDRPWPDDIYTLTGTKTLADELGQQIARHDRVLEHGFVAESYTFIRSERMNRNMYRAKNIRHDPDGWKTTALDSLAAKLGQFLDVYEPYVRRYLGQEWSVALPEEAIAFAEGPMRGDIGRRIDDPRAINEERQDRTGAT
jgi:hypothetical protein